jgi:hypothetical protein
MAMKTENTDYHDKNPAGLSDQYLATRVRTYDWLMDFLVHSPGATKKSERESFYEKYAGLQKELAKRQMVDCDPRESEARGK